MRLLDAAQVADMVTMDEAVGGTLTPHCAALDPARLVRGLADAVAARGIEIHEQTRSPPSSAAGSAPRTAPSGPRSLCRPPRGTRRTWRATTATWCPCTRSWWPPRRFRKRSGPQRGSSAGRHSATSGTCASTGSARPTDGSPSAGVAPPTTTPRESDRSSTATAGCTACSGGFFVDLFPALAGARFTHAWGGNLGIPRDWYPSLGYDRHSGRAYTGGYVGDGVATANLAGRTLADLVTGAHGDLLDLPWLARRSPRWEPEPLRWLGVNAGTAVFALADRTEARTGRPSRLAPAFWRLLGH
jgi:hypothetical protein